MVSSTPSSPSEGEVIESDSEKATTPLVDARSNNVDRLSRKRPSRSRSSSRTRSPRRRVSRSPSRSPYREARGSKHSTRGDRYDRNSNDPRRFKVQYEDHRYDGGSSPRESYRSSESYVSSRKAVPHRYRESNGRPDGNRRRRESYSPQRREDRGHDRPSKRVRIEDDSRYDREHKSTDVGFEAGHKRSSSYFHSVSHQARPSDGMSKSQQHAEYKHDIVQNGKAANTSSVDKDAKSDSSKVNVNSEPSQAVEEPPVDEATLIEERRKRREAIKARFKGQADPVVAQNMPTDELSRQTTPKPGLEDINDQDQDSPRQSLPNTPKHISGRESPVDFVVTKDSDLVNSNTLANDKIPGDEPSAADYDPTMDMQEDKIRYDQDQHRGEASNADSATPNHKATSQSKDVSDPDVAAKSNEDRELDMFGDDDELDMFAEAPAAKTQGDLIAKTTQMPQAKAIEMSMIDDWDDPDGYYKVILGELLDGRYHVHSNLGKGMFSGVIRAIDQKTKRVVAIKLIRNNESMRKAGAKEMEILEKLSQADPDDKKHVVRLERHFEHRGHLCMVFENLSIDLREVLKKFGRDVGINLKAVREYAKQMFLGLSLLRKCNILHADLKPDNMLVNDSRTVLKICDLGSASDATENEITRYLVSRFYRAPEIILGLPYDFGIDMWSVGCTLFELYTGKILFTGRSNNQMLRTIMECRGKFGPKLLKKAEFAGLYFDEMLNFRSIEKDKLSGKDVVRILNFNKPTRDLKTRLLASVKGMDDKEVRELNLFVDLLEKCLNINPEKRCTASEALKHPFILKAKG